jgi:hypothetical protein
MVPFLKIIWFAALGLWFYFPQLLVAQDISGLYSLYQNRQFRTLQERVTVLSGQYPENAEVRFFNALFLEDGEEAAQIYEQLYPGASEQLRKELAKKLSEYYYARGFYTRAEEFQKIKQTEFPENLKSPGEPVPPEHRNTPQTETKKVNFIIQVGAFGQEENARQLKKSLQSHQIVSRIITRLVNGKNLYCVWVNGGNSLDETVRIAVNIKAQFQLEYRILENRKVNHGYYTFKINSTVFRIER